jgi:hypothetical protein
VAKEFCLDVVCSPRKEKSGGLNRLDAQQITKLLNLLYVALRRPVADNPDFEAALTVEASKHEPYI